MYVLSVVKGRRPRKQRPLIRFVSVQDKLMAYKKLLKFIKGSLQACRGQCRNGAKTAQNCFIRIVMGITMLRGVKILFMYSVNKRGPKTDF